MVSGRTTFSHRPGEPQPPLGGRGGVPGPGRVSYSRVAPTPHPPAVKRVSLGGEAVQRQALGPARQGPGRPGSTRAVPCCPSSRAPGPGRGQTCWSRLCVRSLGGWAPSSTTGMPGRQPRVWCLLDLTWPHLASPPSMSPNKSRPANPTLASLGSGQLSLFLPFWEAHARPGSPLPAARWAAGPAARRPGRSGPVAEVQAGLLPSPPVACGRSSWGRGNRPG